MNNTFASEIWKTRENNLHLACGHKVILGLFDVGRFSSFLLPTLVLEVVILMSICAHSTVIFVNA